MTWRNTAADAALVHLLVKPSWLLAPLFVRSDLPAELLPDWQRWWSAAVSFRPGGPAPRQEDLIAFSPGLTKRWQSAGPGFEQWLAAQPDELPPPVEQERLASFATRVGHPPAPRTLTVLVVPFGGVRADGPLFLRPQSDRLVVDAALRLDQPGYLQLLDPVLADFF